MMGIPENEESTQNPNLADFLNGIQTPTRHRNRRNRTPSGRSSSNPNRRVATPSSKSRSKSDRADTERSADKSSNRTTNENDAPSNIRNSRSNSYDDSSSKTPKTKTSSSAKADRRIVLSPPEAVVSPAKKLFNKVTNLGSAKKKQSAMKDACDQTGWKKEAVFELHLNQDVTRDLQNRAEGDQGRGNLGTGNLIVLKCTHAKTHSIHYMCKFIGDNGKFLAKIPDSSDAHKHMFLNTVQNSFAWNAYDSSCGITRLRRFYFFFDDGFEMFAVLLHFFGGQNVGIVKEFLEGESGRFRTTTKLPPHSIVKNEDDMDVNSDDEEHQEAPHTESQETKMYGKVNKKTQNF